MTVFFDFCTSVIFYCAAYRILTLTVYVDLFGLGGRVIAVGAIERFRIHDERISSCQLALLVYHDSDVGVCVVGFGIRWTAVRGCTTTPLKASDNLTIDHCPNHSARRRAKRILICLSSSGAVVVAVLRNKAGDIFELTLVVAKLSGTLLHCAT